MHLFSVFLMGISTNLDNLLLGLSLGLQKKKLCFWANVLIGFLSAAVTAVFCVLSATLSSLGKLPNVVGGGIIIAVGLWSLLPAHQEASCYQAGFSWRETWMVATGLAVNCIPVAFGAGLTGIPPWAAALSVGEMSLLCVAAGNAIGLAASGLQLRPRLLAVIGGGLMIVLGVIEMLC